MANTQSACAVLHVYCHLCPVWRCLSFPHYQVNGMTFGKRIKNLFNIKCICSPQLLSETFLMPRKTLRDIKNVWYIHVFVNYQLFLSDINETRIFSIDFRFIKIRPVGSSCSTLMDRQTDRNNEANSRFSQLCERSQKRACVVAE